MKRLPLLLLALLILAACERPFEAPDLPDATVVEPNLRFAISESSVEFAVRAPEGREVQRIEIDGQAAEYDPDTATWRRTVNLNPLVNRIVIAAINEAGQTIRDTVTAVRARAAVQDAPFELPQPRVHHTATLTDGKILVIGGALSQGGFGASSVYALDLVTSTVREAEYALQQGRVGHTATTLPDGRILLLGGAERTNPQSADQLVGSVELVDPETGSSRLLAIEGAPIRRFFHSATFYETDAGPAVAVYGGLGALEASGPLSVRDDIRRFRITGDRLISLDEPGRSILQYGTSVAGHDAVTLASGNGTRALIAGGYSGLSTEAIVRFPRTGNPSSIAAKGLQATWQFHDAVRISEGVVLFTGGRALDEQTRLEPLRLYLPEDETTIDFANPPLLAQRWGHSATFLPSGRILLIGGVDSSSDILDTAASIVLTF